MRRLLSFFCEGAALAGSLDQAGTGELGLLMATGGSQTRVGSHRMYERLAKALADRGISCFRYDRRGVGDSEGNDPGFRESGADVEAAAQAFRREAGVKRMLGLGLCDGATALALFGAQAGLDGLILVNPWLVEAEADAPAAAAVKAHYRERLASLDGWKRLLSGSVDYRKILQGILKVAKGDADTSLASEVANALRRDKLPLELILATGDATAIAADDALRGRAFHGLSLRRQSITTDSHTFARSGDEEKLRAAVETAIPRLLGQAG